MFSHRWNSALILVHQRTKPGLDSLGVINGKCDSELNINNHHALHTILSQIWKQKGLFCAIQRIILWKKIPLWQFLGCLSSTLSEAVFWCFLLLTLCSKDISTRCLFELGCKKSLLVTVSALIWHAQGLWGQWVMTWSKTYNYPHCHFHDKCLTNYPHKTANSLYRMCYFLISPGFRSHKEFIQYHSQTMCNHEHFSPCLLKKMKYFLLGSSNSSLYFKWYWPKKVDQRLLELHSLQQAINWSIRCFALTNYSPEP